MVDASLTTAPLVGVRPGRYKAERKDPVRQNLNLEPDKTAVISIDVQTASARRSGMFRERKVGQAAKFVLESARQAGRKSGTLASAADFLQSV